VTVSPGGPPGDDPQGHVLASDAEREATVERLRVAVADGRLTMDELSDRSGIAYRARTGAELAALTRDLPSVTSPTSTVSRGPVVVAGDETDRYIAVFSESKREGHWRVPRAAKAVAVFGGVKLDMTVAELGSQEIHVRAVAVFGGIELIVPAGVEVQLTGLAVFGGKSAKVPPAPRGAPVLHVHCTAVFGGIEVKVAGPPWNERLATIRDAIRPPRLPGPPPPPPSA
jgi:Domain of unknown function (DUF1707)